MAPKKNKQNTKVDTKENSNQTIEKENIEDSNPSTNRSVVIVNNNKEELVGEYPMKDGTPQKRLGSLLSLCLELQTTEKSLTNTKLTKLSKNIIDKELVDSVSNSKREDVFKDNTEEELFTEYIQTFISTLNSKSIDIKNELFIKLWSQILIKSLSDISQFGVLINFIPKIYQQTNIGIKTIQEIDNIKNDSTKTTQDKVLEILNLNQNLVFVSSDKIAAGLSSNISKSIDYPIQTLCSRKTGVTTQTVIVQKSQISTLSVVLSYIQETTKLLNLCENIYIRPDLNAEQKEKIVNVIKKIYDIIIENYTKLSNLNTEITFQDNMQIIFDKLFFQLKMDKNPEENSNYNGFICNIIYEISLIPNINVILIDISKVLVNYDYIKVPRWTYHLSNDIFKYIYPLHTEVFTNQLKEKISMEEITSASYDAMYGHDFKMPIITQLGRYFLSAIGQDNLYSIDETTPNSKVEDVCISQTLQLNNYSTINQDGDHYSICFNSNINYLVVTKNEMFYRESEIPWNITLSPLTKQPIYASVDFVSGEPSISVLLSQQVNFIKQRNINQKEILPFSLVSSESSDGKEIKDLINEINDNTIYNEFYTVMTLFDGAAPYGGKPFYILDDYDSSITYKSDKNSTSLLKIITNTNENLDNLQKKWVDDRLDIINTDFLKKLLELNYEQKQILINKAFKPSFKLNQILGTILNSTNSKLKKKITESIYNKFNQLIGEIKSKISLLNQPPQQGRTSRSGIPQNNGHFEDYQQFNNEKILTAINEIIDYTLSSNEENFYAMMNKYILIVLDTNQTDESNISNTLILMNILEVTVKNLFTENLSGIFISLDYQDETNINRGYNELISKQLQKFKKNIDNIDFRIIMKGNFEEEMRKKYPGGIFKNERITTPSNRVKKKSDSAPGAIRGTDANKNLVDSTSLPSPVQSLHLSSNSVSPQSVSTEESIKTTLPTITVGRPFTEENKLSNIEMQVSSESGNESDDDNAGLKRKNLPPPISSLASEIDTQIDTQRDSQYQSFNTPLPVSSPEVSPETSPFKYGKTGTDIEGKSPRGGKTLKLRIKNHRKSIKKNMRSTKTHTQKHMKNKKKHNKTP